MIKKTILALFFSFFLTNLLYAHSETLKFGRFGTVTLYENTSAPSRLVLFISGDGGWNSGVVDMAQALTSFHALVAGIDINTYLRHLEMSKTKCLYPAADFESLSQYIQKKFHFIDYKPPILVGYSSGASLVYVLLAQAPVNTFAGGISLGFSPNLTINKPLCRGSGLHIKLAKDHKSYDFLPVRLLKPWTVLQGTIDKVCNPAVTERFVRKVQSANLVILPKVGHGYSVQRNWMPQFKNAYSEMVTETEGKPKLSPKSLSDLPIVEVPSPNSQKDILAVMMSGDGGWASIDQGLSKTLAANGIPVAGVNSLKYFWKRKTPEKAAVDLERIIRYYMLKWNKQKLLIVGYSLGADVLPFMIHRLPEDLKKRIELITFLSPSHRVDFQFHLSYWLGGGDSKTSLKVLPEIEKLQGLPLLCLYGSDETNSICINMPKSLATVIPLEGGHHYDGNYTQIANDIFKILNERTSH